MATAPFLGEIRSFSFGYPPKGWAVCNGQLLSINTNQALFALLGTQFGGNGQTTFALPNLQGRVPIGIGTSVSGAGSYAIGQFGGTPTVTLTTDQTPAHTHTANASTAANTSNTPSALLPGAFPSLAGYTTDASQLVALAAGAVTSAGASQPHENRQPYLALNICICIAGIYPPRS